jgi:HSP20 family molecular chaperone IbpA
MLEISAKRGKEKENEEEEYIHKKREYIHFYRPFRLSTNVKKEESTSKIGNGILIITLPKMNLEEPAKNINRIIF